MFLGIEIGGTKLQLGLGSGDGKLVAAWRGSVIVPAGAAGIRRQILEAVPRLLAQAHISRSTIRGVGVGFGGPVDDIARCVVKSHQIEGWDGFPLADWLADQLGWPAVVGNDADVAGLAEALFGAGRGLSPIFYITIGSGIGGGLIIEGQIYRGCGRGAAEIGHLHLWRRGTAAVPLEQLASGWGIAAAAKSCGLGDISAAQVAERARAGDAVALGVLSTAREHLADAISQMIALLCPRRIVIGGGVAQMGEELLFQPLRQSIEQRVFLPFKGCYDIVPAALGTDVVLHGALALARRRPADTLAPPVARSIPDAGSSDSSLVEP
jgi:glucokinase